MISGGGISQQGGIWALGDGSKANLLFIFAKLSFKGLSLLLAQK